MPHHGKRLLRVLAEQRKSQAWLAGELRITRQQISKWIQSRSWHSRTVHKVARALGVPVGCFYE